MFDGKTDLAQSGAPAAHRACAKTFAILALLWWTIAMFATTVRIESNLWRPIFDIFFSQALLLEAVVPHSPPALVRTVWLLLYVLVFMATWLLIERVFARNESHCLRRAVVASLLIQLTLFVLGLGVAPE